MDEEHFTEEDQKRIASELKKYLKSDRAVNALLEEAKQYEQKRIIKPPVQKYRVWRFLPEIFVLHFKGKHGASFISKFLRVKHNFKVSPGYLIKSCREIDPRYFTGKAGDLQSRKIIKGKKESLWEIEQKVRQDLKNQR